MEEVQNSKSVLFQFINENNSVKIGFRNFIVNEVNDQELEKIVSEEKVIAIKWPNCDIGPATKMNARLRASPDFNFTVVKVIAFGGKCLKLYDENYNFILSLIIRIKP